MIKNIITINSVDYDDTTRTAVRKVVSEFNSTSSFECNFDNIYGKYNNTFTLNEDVVIKADITTGTPTTKVFRGIIEDIKFIGTGTNQRLKLSGRDYGAILQDIIAEPRIFKNTEASEIIKALVRQNLNGTGITTNNVNTTSTTIDKITFNGLALFDCFRKIAQISGYFFYVDEDKDLNFKEQAAVSSGETFDNTNVLKASFTQSDDDIFNSVKVVGDRQLTAAQQIFTTGVDNTGSVYKLDSKPYNTSVILSGATNTLYQPGGVIFVNDPATNNAKYLVDFPNSEIVLTSGTTAGDNTLSTGSVVIIDYDQSTPLIKTLVDNSSITNYGKKNKEIIDKNIKDLDEASDVASAFIAENKDPKTRGDMRLKGIVNVNPGETAVVDIPSQGQSSQTYTMIRANYNFNKEDNLNESALDVTVSKKVNSIVDLFTQHEIRLRQLETAEVESSITNLELFTGSVGISGTTTLISTGIGSGFYFNVTGHDVFDSPSSLLGPWQGGSVVLNI